MPVGAGHADMEEPSISTPKECTGSGCIPSSTRKPCDLPLRLHPFGRSAAMTRTLMPQIRSVLPRCGCPRPQSWSRRGRRGPFPSETNRDGTACDLAWSLATGVGAARGSERAPSQRQRRRMRGSWRGRSTSDHRIEVPSGFASRSGRTRAGSKSFGCARHKSGCTGRLSFQPFSTLRRRRASIH